MVSTGPAKSRQDGASPKKGKGEPEATSKDRKNQKNPATPPPPAGGKWFSARRYPKEVTAPKPRMASSFENPGRGKASHPPKSSKKNKTAAVRQMKIKDRSFRQKKQKSLNVNSTAVD